MIVYKKCATKPYSFLVINMNILQVISLLILLQERLWKNTIEKQTKTIKDKEEKQIKIIKEHGKKLVESNALVKKWL